MRRLSWGRATIPTMTDHAPSPARLRRVAAALERIEFVAAGEEAEAQRRRAATAAGHYLAPRLSDESDTIVLAVVGPSGSGKSTIVNSIAQRRISDIGPLRPTTVEPVAWTDGVVPATLDALRGCVPGWLVDSFRGPPEGVVVVDTPPLEVVDHWGVPVVHQILGVADAVLFVAGATRYADANAFALLEIGVRRELPTVVVLNRLPETPELQQVIAADFAAKLAARRLLPRADPGLVMTVAEGHVASDTGALIPEAVTGVAKEIEAMADPQSRPEIIATAVAGSLRRLREDLAAIRSHVIDGAGRRVELVDPMRSIYRAEERLLISAVRSGKFASLEADRLIEGLASAATRRAGLAARATAESWLESAPHVIERAPDLFGHGVATLGVARERLGFWLSEVDDLPRRASRRRLSARKQRRVAGSLRVASIDPRHAPDRMVARQMAKSPGLLESARDLLADELRGILETDSLRFVERLGPAVGGGTLTELSTGSVT